MDRRNIAHLIVLTLLAAFILGASTLLAEDDKDKDKGEKSKKIYYDASIYQTGRAGMPILRVQFMIKEFSTSEDAAKLAQILKDSGQAGMADALSKAEEKGNISINNRLGYKVGFIRQIPAPDGGSIIRMATDRPITIPEVWGNTRSSDYTIGVVEMKLDADGKGEGIMIYAAKVKFSEQGMLEIETYGIAPAKLINIRKWK